MLFGGYREVAQRTVGIGAVLPGVQSQWALAAALRDAGRCNVLSIRRTDTLMLWSCGVCADVAMGEGELEGVEDVVLLENGGRLSVVLAGRKPRCRRCRWRGHLQKDCREEAEGGCKGGGSDPDGEVEEEDVRESAESAVRVEGGGGGGGGNDGAEGDGVTKGWEGMLVVGWARRLSQGWKG